MGKLIYSAMASLDGFVADERGNFDWAEPDEELHFINDRERAVGTYLYGLRMYEVMQAWETEPALAEHSATYREFADIWQAADKVVYSTSLRAPPTERTRLERHFDPDKVRGLKTLTSRDLTVAGPTLAAEAFRAHLVDEYHLYQVPVIVGGGTRALPEDVTPALELVDERRFDGGIVHLQYLTRNR